MCVPVYVYVFLVNIFHGFDENGSSHVIHPTVRLHLFTQQAFMKPLLYARTCAKLYCAVVNAVYSVLDLFTS